MKVSIIGCGYVGLVTGLGFAELGNPVVFVDSNGSKIKSINDLIPPIYEPGLEELIKKNEGKFYATNDYFEALDNSEVSFICVGTPSKEDGSLDLRQVEEASSKLGKALAEKEFHVIVVKSTVLPGTTENFVKPIIEKESGKKAFDDFGLAMNPEFLREGNAVEDFFNPDRIVIGVKDERTKSVLEELYKPFDCPKLITEIKTAEMIKYASNAFLATKISFANEIGNICKKLGIDVYKVFEGVGLDHRINPSFFRAGIGFGGSCFPKDVRALIRKSEELGEDLQILKAVIEVNEKQPLKMIELLKKHIPDLRGKISVFCPFLGLK
ncbi:UDP-glucose dehydrogenase (ugd-1) [Archaeoglobus fulgidus DSM 4304]|uniref:UDP-glucose 6-dehydrogenase n=2 Tax=Archaeoglobus fulgidus TaxID=2234 RepID=O29940_ARCFU|nr:UDP-glucose/GDP-mannose dehydrogenase family protein [Archaeoglobus fulgidus]AAB90929.1 UDP-glucose dehydrogenase (ugd-1) [Archaeoglobus fulgidus DSM 4304]AIG97124.1 nucleotide sugar dehydrogenase [Archaeoglobus fulgidus DSM 8774]